MKTHPESKCPELLANYCDMLLRKTPLSKKLTPEETEAKLRDVVSESVCVVYYVCVKNVYVLVSTLYGFTFGFSLYMHII